LETNLLKGLDQFIIKLLFALESKVFDDWITTDQGQKLVGFIEYLRHLVRSGLIDAKKWGREWMVNRKSLEEYLAIEKKPGPKPSSK
jgi:hypothetical protein